MVVTATAHLYSLTCSELWPLNVSRRVVEHQMGAGWGNVSAGHMEPCEEAHQGGRARQSIKLVASVVETHSLQAFQFALIRANIFGASNVFLSAGP